mgnify:CR=1 FL=1|tara:strand:- start:9393 stop:12920 length:3528 start_codon:yes stop_codon:yes gene_type:complete
MANNFVLPEGFEAGTMPPQGMRIPDEKEEVFTNNQFALPKDSQESPKQNNKFTLPSGLENNTSAPEDNSIATQIDIENKNEEVMQDARARVEELFKIEENRRLDLAASDEQIQNYITQIENEKKENFATLDKLYGNLTREQALEKLKEKNPDSILFKDTETEAYERAGVMVGKASDKKERLISYLTSPNAVTRKLANKLVDSGMTNISEINAIIQADSVFNPVTSIVDVPILYGDAQEAFKEGRIGAAGGNLALAGLSALPLVGAIGVTKKGAKEVGKRLGVKSASIENYTRAQKAIDAEAAEAVKMRERAINVAEKNVKTRNDLIRAFEENNLDAGQRISKTDKDGNLVIDPDLVREVGAGKTKEIYDTNFLGIIRETEETFKTGDGGTLGYSDLAKSTDQLINPLLDPDKIDGLTAVVSKLKESKPDAFGKKTKNTVIDDLFDYTVTGDLKQTEELMDLLSYYGLSFEDYILSVVSSGSKAGKILNQLSQIKRKKSAVAKGQAELAAGLDMKSELGKFWKNYFLRFENIRRGSMVSALATAARNVTSFGIRAPAEALADIFEDATFAFAREQNKLVGAGKAFQEINPFAKTGSYTDAMRGMKYIFAKPLRAKDYTEYLLERPELRDINDSLFGGINELQKLTGRGQAETVVGKAFDKAYGVLEDGVSVVNIPNRMQEFMIRRGTFLGELERLVRKEWDMDLLKSLDEGKIRDILNDATTVRPSDARSIHAIMDDAARKALDVTYAKQPDFWLFKDISNFITRTGLTTVVPFPRFMFNSIELMTKYMAGGTKPLFKMLTGKEVTRGDARLLGQNIIGLGAANAFYQYRMSDDAKGTKYNELRTEDGNLIDITPQFPLRQFAYIAEAVKQGMIGDRNWSNFDPDLTELAETFLGSTFRTGTGNVMLDTVREAVVQSEDIVDTSRRNEFLGRFFGQLAASVFTPLYQLSDAQRLQGERPTEYADFKPEPSMGSGFTSEFIRSLKQRGLSAPSTEKDLPQREFIMTEDAERVGLGTRMLFGINMKKGETKAGEYLKTLGLEEFDISSRSQSPTIRNFENSLIREYLPLAAEMARLAEKDELAAYDEQSAEYKKKYSKRKAGVAAAKEKFKSSIKIIKEKLQDGSAGQASPYVQELLSYRRMGKMQRKKAERAFVKQFGNPDYSNIEHLRVLRILGSN